MPMYIFHFCNLDGGSPAFESYEMDNDAATFAKAGDLLAEHRSCHHVEVWEGDRPVVARHREQPIIRPVAEEARGPGGGDRPAGSGIAATITRRRP